MADGFEELDKMFDDMLNKFPQKKRELMEDVGDKMYDQVINNIDNTVKEDTGNLKAGVTKILGSKGGYAAVKPNYGIAPHTHLIEDGHRIIRGGKIVGWANGKHMYRNAIEQVSDEVEKMAESMIDELVGEIVG